MTMIPTKFLACLCALFVVTAARAQNTESFPSYVQGNGLAVLPLIANTMSLAPSPPTSIVYVPCGATLSSYINASSPAGTFYQLAGSPAASCTYSVNSSTAITLPAGTVNITIAGDCSSPVGANTIIDGGGANFNLVTNVSRNAGNVSWVCLTIQHFYTYSTATCTSTGVPNAIYTFDGWVFSHDTLGPNGCGALGIEGVTKVDHSLIKNNGETGLSIFAGFNTAVGDVVIYANEFSGNGNTADTGYGAGAVKAIYQSCPENGVWGTQGVQILNNYFHNDNGTGPWSDCQLGEFVVVGNTIVGEYFNGIRCEVSMNCRISHNVLLNNGSVGGNNAACILADSSNGSIIDNNFCLVNSGYGHGIGIEYNCRSDAPQNEMLTQVHDNTVVFTGATQGWTGLDDATNKGGNCGGNKHPSAWAPNTLFYNNWYWSVATTDSHFNWGASISATNLSAIQSSGSTETNSIIQAGTPANPAGCTASAALGQFCDRGSGW